MSDDKPVVERDFAAEESGGPAPAAASSSAAHPFRSASRTRPSSSTNTPAGLGFGPSLQPSVSTTSSFVYPVRSLLAKNIQPATDEQNQQQPPVRLGGVGRSPSEDARHHSREHGEPSRSDASDAPHRLARRGSFHQEDFGSVPALIRSASVRTQPKTSTQTRAHLGRRNTDNSLRGSPPPSDALAEGETAVAPAHDSPSAPTESPPKGDDLSTTMFAAALSAAATLTQIAHEPGFNDAGESAGGPRTGAIPSTPSSSHSEYFTTPEGPDDGSAAQEPDAEDVRDDRPQSPMNYSKAGIVHLGPSHTTPANSESQSGSVGSTKSRGRSTEPSSSAPTSNQRPGTDTAVEDDDEPSGSASGDVLSRAISGSSRGSEDPLLVTHKYDFATDEDGHHVIVGREGKLTRCEDEPIRTPGAVQGYGVLIALAEDLETGNLIVRQVSENSTEILGLSPRYLFSLECFTDVLPDGNVDAFWDNIQFLNTPATDVDDSNGEDSIHVFLLNGWGQPGSAHRDDPEAGPQRRRVWHCWCAAHRPQAVTSSTGDGPSSTQDGLGMIILEFELERDAHNPLYPPPSAAEAMASGMSSPQSGVESVSTESMSASGSAGTGSSSTERSGQSTLVSAGGRSEGVVSDTTAASAAASSIASSLPPTDTPGTSLTAMPASTSGLAGPDDWEPTPEHIYESTTSRAKPLLALERLRQMNRALAEAPAQQQQQQHGSQSRRRGNQRRGGAGPSGVGMMDIFAVMSQINEQLGAAQNLEIFLKVTAGVIKDLTQFHRVLVYQFDETWNGQVVAELVDWHRTHDLYMGLHFPASDIPAQARELYAINKVRLLYDRDLPTARIVVRSSEDLDPPLNMTHCYLRAMSPIHIKYLGNMGVRASMSISIMAFGALWGLIACHSYGMQGMRVSFPVRQMLRLLSQSISRNIERLSYAQRLHTRKLINTVTSDAHPGGYIVSNADDLLSLFDADYGMLVIGEGAKILGPNHHGQEILVVAEYLRLKQFNQMQVSQAVTIDYPDLKLSTGLEIIAGLLYVPLSSGGKDFIAFLRKGQPREVHWAGKPFKAADHESNAVLEPRKSFKSWSQIVAGRSRIWTDEQLETAGVLALVYGKFIEVWRQKESALQSTKLTNLLLSNASHEVRTPLNHIINYLELALNGSLDIETRDNLKKSHLASKSLLFTINDLLDLTRLESGNEISFNEPFDLRLAIEEAAQLYRHEAARRDITFNLDLESCPTVVAGDSKKIQTVVANLTGNALKYTERGIITVEARAFDEPHGLRDAEIGIAVEIVVTDTGCGISGTKLESIFREFEQVETLEGKADNIDGVGLGLAVVAHIVEQLGGQLRVDSKVGEGSRFSFLIPFAIPTAEESTRSPTASLLGRSRPSSTTGSARSANSSARSAKSEIDHFVQAIAQSHLDSGSSPPLLTNATRQSITAAPPSEPRVPQGGYFEVAGSSTPIRGLKVNDMELDGAVSKGRTPAMTPGNATAATPVAPPQTHSTARTAPRNSATSKNTKIIDPSERLRVLIVEDDDINRILLAKRLSLSGHTVVNTTNGQECVDKVEGDREFDCVLMDVQMPILNGFQATVRVRSMEREDAERPETSQSSTPRRLSHQLNGRIPIFAVSASLREDQRDQMKDYGLDGWILKPVDFKRMFTILRGITDPEQRKQDLYDTNRDWEFGGWLTKPRDGDAQEKGDDSAGSGGSGDPASTAL